MTDAIAKPEPAWIAVSPGRPPYRAEIARTHGISVAQWRVLVEAIFPSAKSSDSVLLAIDYCKARGLDPFKRPVHIVPVWSAKTGDYIETVWPGISELRTTAVRTNAYAGCEPTTFGPTKEQEFVKPAGNGKAEQRARIAFPEWAQVTVYRIVNGQRCAFPGPRVYWLETCSTEGKSGFPNERWRRSPSGQIEKCAEAAALRRAFPEELGGEYAAEEMDGKEVGDEKSPEATRIVTDQAEKLAEALKRGVTVNQKPSISSQEPPSSPDPVETQGSVAVDQGSGSTEAPIAPEVVIEDADLAELKVQAKAKGFDTPRKLRSFCQERFKRDPETLLAAQYNELAKEWGF